MTKDSTNKVASAAKQRLRASLRLATLLLVMLAVGTTSAVACRNYRPWPTAIDDPRLKPDHIPMRARIVEEFVSSTKNDTIAGSLHSVILEVEVAQVLRDGGVHVGQKILIIGRAHVCEDPIGDLNALRRHRKAGEDTFFLVAVKGQDGVYNLAGVGQ